MRDWRGADRRPSDWQDKSREVRPGWMAEKGGKLSDLARGPFSRHSLSTRATRRSRREGGSHHGVEKRTASHARRRFKRKNRAFWRAQFCTEVARSERFELPTLRFEV